MSTITKPILLDETGQSINESLAAIKKAIENTETVLQGKEELQAETERLLTTIPEDYTALTEEVSKLSNEIVDMFDFMNLKPYSPTFEQGTFNQANGNPSKSTTRARTIDFIEVNPKNTVITVSCISLSIATFISILSFDENYNFLGETGWITDYAKPNESKKYLVENTNARYIKINSRLSANKTITDEVLADYNTGNYIKVYRDEQQLQNTHDIKALSDVVGFDSNVYSVSHRGGVPENTLIAFKESKEKGFKYVECDVRFTSDGVAVLLHDESINRTARNTDGTTIAETVNISEITYEQALQYDFGIKYGQQYAGTKIPKFSDFIKLCKYIGLRPYIELKMPYGTPHETIYPLVDIVKVHGMLKKSTWVGSVASIVQAIAEKDDTARCGLFVTSVSQERIDTVNDLLKTENNEVFVSCTYTTLTDEGVQICINNNMPLEINVCNDVDYIKSMNPYISGVLSDSINAENVLMEEYK